MHDVRIENIDFVYLPTKSLSAKRSPLFRNQDAIRSSPKLRKYDHWTSDTLSLNCGMGVALILGEGETGYEN